MRRKKGNNPDCHTFWKKRLKLRVIFAKIRMIGAQASDPGQHFPIGGGSEQVIIGWMDFINLAVGIAGLTMTILGLLVTLIYRPIDRKMRQYFILFFSLLIVYTGSVFVGQIADYLPNPRFVMQGSVFLESLSSSLLMPLLTAYMLHLTGQTWKRSYLFDAIAGLWFVYLALLVYTQFSTAIYTIDSAGVYERGPWYSLLLMPPAMILVLNLWGVFHRWAKLGRKQRTALLVYLAVPLLCTVIQMFFYGLLTIALGTVAAALVMFLVLLSDQQETFIRQTEENARREFDIRILQMRPHFIYSALASIYYITQEEPKRGLQAIQDFSVYLRKVFEFVTKREPIPFEEELEHTRAYLAIEQARFEDKLNVTFDTPHTGFCLPPLTLQPIVENAVKHGMDPEIERLNVLIRTRKADGGSEIIVEDDGADFIPHDDAEEGVGLASTRLRLERMCGGTLDISLREGGGAVATLRIPDQA